MLILFVTFPSGKLYIGSILALFFDNKLEFSDIKIAIGQGFRQSNFKVKQSSDRSESLVFQVQTFRFISDIGVIDELSASGLGRILRVCTWQPSHLATVLLWCLLKVRLCSPLQLGLTFLVGASLDYPQLLRLALPNTLHARISSVSYPVHIPMSFSDIVYVQNSARKYISLKYVLFAYCLEALAGVWDNARQARRQLCAKFGRSQTPRMASIHKSFIVLRCR